MSDNKCKTCGKSSFGKAKFTLIGFVCGLSFAGVIFSLGYYVWVEDLL